MTLAPPSAARTCALDLTRWNRAGLTRFRYVDGNAAGLAGGTAASRSSASICAASTRTNAHAGEHGATCSRRPVVRMADLPRTAMPRYADAVAWDDAVCRPCPAAAREPPARAIARLLAQYGRPLAGLCLGDHARLRPCRACAARPPRRLCQRGLSAHGDAVGQSAQARRDGELPADAAGLRRRRPWRSIARPGDGRRHRDRRAASP